MIPKVSVIVPIYKAQDFLSKCVDSVLLQDEESLELVLVDDGSPDHSGKICDAYAGKDHRVKVIHQGNAGVSAARNAGIQAAEGRYIGFVDSDDWIDPDMFSRMLKVAEETKADVVMCDATTVYSDGRTQADTMTQLSGNQIFSKSDFTPSLLLEMAGSACRCIYINDKYNDKLRKHPLAFPLGVKFSEDRIFNLYAFGQADRVAYVKESFYNRYMNSGSAVHRFHADYFEAYKKAAAAIENALYDAWEDDEALQKAYAHQFFCGALGAVCNYYYKTSPMTNAERKAAVRRLCEDTQLQDMLAKADNLERKERWLQEKKTALLIAYARLANRKHGR